MKWKAETGERDVLTRIVALLLALADLAESAAGRSRPVRWLLPWSLWQAEAVARGFVRSSLSSAPGRRSSPALVPVRDGHDCLDPLTLAVSLRSLAWIVRAMAAQFRPLLVRASGAGGRYGHPRHDVFLRVPGTATSPVERRDSS